MEKKQKTSAWQRVLAARAMGREVDPADVEEAQAAAKPGTVGWAAEVAARVAPERQAAPGGEDRFRAAVLDRLGVKDGGPDAA